MLLRTRAGSEAGRIARQQNNSYFGRECGRTLLPKRVLPLITHYIMIGIFDSGLGGLTALKELRELCPECDIVYFGDTARVPYGTRSKDILYRYADEDIKLLLSKGADRILAACGTVSSVALPVIEHNYPVKVTGVVAPAAREAVRATKNNRIGVIGTGATISSGAFSREIAALSPNAKVAEVACPLFVPLVENGFIEKDCNLTRLAVAEYLKQLRDFGADTLILGCTHFPIIAHHISEYLGEGVTLINSGSAAARELAKEPDTAKGSGKCEIFVSDSPASFEAVAKLFLGSDTVPAVHTVRIGE